jgi:hypothetical protein
MRALTLRHPWAFSIAHWGKRIENRSWKPPTALIGQRIAIHGGAKPGKADGYRAGAVRIFADLFEVYGHPAAFHEATTYRELANIALNESSGIVATAIIERWVKFGSDDIAEQDPWFDKQPGNIGWVLRDVVTLEKPVPCKGAQGLWNLPDDVLAQVIANVVKEPESGTGT